MVKARKPEPEGPQAPPRLTKIGKQSSREAWMADTRQMLKIILWLHRDGTVLESLKAAFHNLKQKLLRVVACSELS